MPLHPDILRTISRAITHICDHILVHHTSESTAARPEFVRLDPRVCVAVLIRPEVRSIEQRVNRLALAGDMAGTRRACRDWQTAIRTALQEVSHA